jgi:hypothetical protein
LFCIPVSFFVYTCFIVLYTCLIFSSIPVSLSCIPVSLFRVYPSSHCFVYLNYLLYVFSLIVVF